VGYSIYVPHHEFASGFSQLEVAIKTPLDVGTLAPAIRDAVWALKPNLPVPEITTMSARISYSTADRRFFTAILVLFAVVASLLASLGIYGSMLYSVRQQRRELGIRLAMGALQGGIVAMVVRRGMTLTAVGIGLGLAGGWMLSRTLESALFGITTHDVSTYVAVVLLLATVAFAACYLPARRAALVDPTETLKAE
jgi:putative ABC transport system permease protein